MCSSCSSSSRVPCGAISTTYRGCWGEGGWWGSRARVAETRWLANRNSRNVALIMPLHQQVAESVTVAPTVTHMSICIGTSSLTARYEVRQAPTAAVALFKTLSGRSSKYVDNCTQSLCHHFKNGAFSLKAPYFFPTPSTGDVSQGSINTHKIIGTVAKLFCKCCPDLSEYLHSLRCVIYFMLSWLQFSISSHYTLFNLCI